MYIIKHFLAQNIQGEVVEIYAGRLLLFKSFTCENAVQNRLTIKQFLFLCEDSSLYFFLFSSNNCYTGGSTDAIVTPRINPVSICKHGQNLARFWSEL